MSLSWSQRARVDLLAIGDYIATGNPSAARAWVERLREVAALAAAAPGLGRVVPECAREDVRETFLRDYRVVYRVVANGIVVLTVCEGHRLLRDVDTHPDVPDEPAAR
jgi:plasmid stabilization system protein ParE